MTILPSLGYDDVYIGVQHIQYLGQILVSMSPGFDPELLECWFCTASCVSVTQSSWAHTQGVEIIAVPSLDVCLTCC